MHHMYIVRDTNFSLFTCLLDDTSMISYYNAYVSVNYALWMGCYIEK